MEPNENPDVAQPKVDTEAKPVEKAEPKPESPDYRPKLSDEEQLAVLEGRAQRLRTKLGVPKDEAPTSSAPDSLSQKAFLRSAGITSQDEVDLALKTAKKWGVEIDQIVDDEDFVAKLDKLRTTKSIEAATSDVKGSGSGDGSAKNTPAYWIAKGTPPTADQVPDRKTRATIARAMMKEASGQGGKKFYNE